TACKYLNRQLRVLVTIRCRRSHSLHIVGHSRQRHHPRRMVHHLLHQVRSRTLLPQQIKHHPRIEIARPSSHHHTPRRRQPHSRIDRLAVHHRSHTAPAPQMRNHH